MKQAILCAMLGCSLWLGAASAATNEQLYALQKTTVDGEEVFLNGLAAAEKLSNDYYYAALYLQNKSTIDTDVIFYESAKRLEILFAANRVSARAFGRELAGNIKLNNSADELQAYRNEIRKMMGLLKGSYKKGDRLQFDISSSGVIRLNLNGNNIGRFTKSGFDKVFLKGWLGDRPFSTKFKQGLMGTNQDNDAIVQLQRKYVDTGNL